MGSVITEERGLFAALNNCAFVSTDNLKEDLAKPFCFLMDMSMLGVGVGFDVKGANQLIVKGPNTKRPIEVFQVPDTREGWVESVKLLIESYFLGTNVIEFDYSLVRGVGEPIKGFGGYSSGHEPLKEAHESIRNSLDLNVGVPITMTTITDIMNMIGKCVVAGNVRRTAEIVFGPYSSDEYLDLKNYKVNPQRAPYGWTSNNSIFAELGMDYTQSAERTQINGEPGYAWLQNMQAYSRMNNGPDFKDAKAKGGNPCLEQTLESYELCCLVETFPNNHESLEDYLRTLKFAYLYAKTVTLGETHWPDTNRVLLRNRRIGCSMSGIAQFLVKHNLHVFKEWCEKGYDVIQHHDKVYSDWFAIPMSIKKTSIKPSGTVSLVAGATPGMHWPESRFFIRRMRLGKTSTLLPALIKAGYHVEPDKFDSSSMVVSVPIDMGEGIRTLPEVSMWEQLSLAAFIQKYWADNQVSCTVTFIPETEGPQIKNALDYFQYQLKGISFLPKLEKGAYEQMPYEAITEAEYIQFANSIQPLVFDSISGEEAEVDKFCNNDVCEIIPKTKGA
jgi:adenosylcobalamin-dependent ribonucleoside-triphosphate reductase